MPMRNNWCMTGTTGSLDLTNLPRFLAHLGHRERDPNAAMFAKMLLEGGHDVMDFWGPEQMDVWRLRIRRGAHAIAFGIERGFADAVLVNRATDADVWANVSRLDTIVLDWARATSTPIALIDERKQRTDLATYGIAALDWLAAAHPPTTD